MADARAHQTTIFGTATTGAVVLYGIPAGECRSGTAASLDEARAEFEAAHDQATVTEKNSAERTVDVLSEMIISTRQAAAACIRNGASALSLDCIDAECEREEALPRVRLNLDKDRRRYAGFQDPEVPLTAGGKWTSKGWPSYQ
jgi:hypothetical protein